MPVASRWAVQDTTRRRRGDRLGGAAGGRSSPSAPPPRRPQRPRLLGPPRADLRPLDARRARRSSWRCSSPICPPRKTLIDVGAGAGRHAVPLAERLEWVTAVEPSEGMRAQIPHRDNMTVVASTWEDAEVAPADLRHLLPRPLWRRRRRCLSSRRWSASARERDLHHAARVADASPGGRAPRPDAAVTAAAAPALQRPLHAADADGHRARRRRSSATRSSADTQTSTRRSPTAQPLFGDGWDETQARADCSRRCSMRDGDELVFDGGVTLSGIAHWQPRADLTVPARPGHPAGRTAIAIVGDRPATSGTGTTTSRASSTTGCPTRPPPSRRSRSTAIVVGLQRLRPYAPGLLWYEGLRVASSHRRQGIARAHARVGHRAGARAGLSRDPAGDRQPRRRRSCSKSAGFEPPAWTIRWWRGRGSRVASRRESPTQPRPRSSGQAIASSPGLELYGGVTRRLQRRADLGADELARLAGIGMLRVGPGGRAIAGLREPWGDNIAVAFLAGRGGALRDLLLALRFEADADGLDHVTVALPRGPPGGRRPDGHRIRFRE